MVDGRWLCSQCGTENDGEARRCHSCGKWRSLFDHEGHDRRAVERPPASSPVPGRSWRPLLRGLPIVIALAWLAFSFLSSLPSDDVERVDADAIEQTAGATAQPFEDSRACDVYVVPLDRPSERLASIVATRVGRALPVETCLRPSMRIDPSAIDDGRSQLNLGSLIDQLAVVFQAVWRDRPSTVVGVTSLDVFLPTQPSWPHAYSTFDTVRRTQGYSVISSARLGSGEVLIERAEKLARRDIGFVFFGLPSNLDPVSALYAYFVDLNDLDRMTMQYSSPEFTTEFLLLAREAFLAGEGSQATS